METKKCNTPGPDLIHQRCEKPQPASRQFNSRLLLHHSGWIQSLISNLNDLFTLRPKKAAPATLTAHDGWVKDENFSRSQVVSFAVHGGLAMLVVLSLTNKIPVVENVNKLIPSIAVPDSETLRSLFRKASPNPNHGGGGGGDRNPIPVTIGDRPRFNSAIQIVPPSIQSNPNAKLEVPTTLIGPDRSPIIIKDLDIWGDPNATALTDSNGPGTDGGMGTGKRGGIGPGEGPGYGPGKDGGWGKDVYVPGGPSGIRYPTCEYCPRPEYSDEARHSRYQGSVLLYVVILTNGTAGDIQVVKSPGLGLDVKAMEAIRTWKFNPALGPNGKPVAVVVQVEVAFQLF